MKTLDLLILAGVAGVGYWVYRKLNSTIPVLQDEATQAVSDGMDIAHSVITGLPTANDIGSRVASETYIVTIGGIKGVEYQDIKTGVWYFQPNRFIYGTDAKPIALLPQNVGIST